MYVCVFEYFYSFQNLSDRFQFKYLIVEKTESQDMFSNKKCGKYKKMLNCELFSHLKQSKNEIGNFIYGRSLLCNVLISL